MTGNICRAGAALFLLAVLLTPVGADGRAASAQSLPLNLPATQWRPLARCWDKHLQMALDRTVRTREEWHGLIYQKKMAVALVDLRHPARPRFAQVNGDVMMYAASLPKLAVLLAAFQAMDRGVLRATPELQMDLIEMIRRSDNPATNQVINRVGLPAIEAAVRDPRYRFYEPRHGGLWVGSRYGFEAQPNPDPLKNILHGATANQVANFYYLLAYGKLINPERSRQMLKILAFPDLPDKFVAALGKSAPPHRLYRKSGHWKIWFSDSVLVWADPGRRYILVALVEDPQGEKILRDLLPAAEALLQRLPAAR